MSTFVFADSEFTVTPTMSFPAPYITPYVAPAVVYTGNGSSQAQVIDLLLVGIRAQLADQSILVADGFPGTNEPQVIVTVGGTEEATADGAQSWAYLGAKRKWDKYSVAIVVSVVVGGDGVQSEVVGADAQQAARNLAFSVMRPIELWLKSDPTLGQFFNTGQMQGGWLGLEGVQLLQSNDTNAAVGAIAALSLKVAITALI